VIGWKPDDHGLFGVTLEMIENRMALVFDRGHEINRKQEEAGSLTKIAGSAQ
jgi:hypothetical protein